MTEILINEHNNVCININITRRRHERIGLYRPKPPGLWPGLGLVAQIMFGFEPGSNDRN